jgi:replicative DNA helicase
MEIGKKLPCDLEAEKTVISAILSNHPQAAEVFDLLNAEDFMDSRNRVILVRLKKMWEDGKPVELPALTDALSGSHEMEEAGGIGYVASLAEFIPSKMRIDRYAGNVRESFVHREFLKACSRWMDEVRHDNLSEMLDKARDIISGLTAAAATQNKAISFREAAMEFMAKIKEPQVGHLITGLPEVDERTGGFRAGEVGIITAETGVGKTFFALQIARKSCMLGRHLLFCSGEMLAGHLMGRVLASESRVSYQKIRHPLGLHDLEYMRLLDLAPQQCPDCRIVDGELSLFRIRQNAWGLSSSKLGGIIVDYDELVEIRGAEKEWDQQRILIRSLKSLAMDLKVPVVIVSQLRKENSSNNSREDKRPPTLQRLYGSSAKAKHASVVLYVDRPFVQDLQGDETAGVVYVLKSRDGRIGKTECTFNISTLTFEQGYTPPTDWTSGRED